MYTSKSHKRRLEEGLSSQLENDDLEEALLLSYKANKQDFLSDDLTRGVQDPVGLKNSNNSCYFNAWIQCMFAIDYFYKFITDFNAPEDIERLLDRLSIRTEKDRTRKKMSVQLIQAIQKLFVFMKYGNSSTLNPSEIIDCIVDNDARPLNRGEELDLGEFIINVEERIVEGLALHRHIEMTTDERYYKEYFSNIEKLFLGKTRESLLVEGNDLKQFQYTEATLGLVNLNIAKKDLKSAFHDYLNYDVDVNSSDGRVTQAKKQVRITELPKILTFQLQRVTYDAGYGLLKLNDPFAFDFKMSIDKLLRKKDVATKTNFKLRGIIIQEGDAESGHYYAIVLDSNNDKWIKYNDSSIREVSEQEAMDLAIGKGDISSADRSSYGRPCAYCLFYVQEEPSSAIPETPIYDCQSALGEEENQTPSGEHSRDDHHSAEHERGDVTCSSAQADISATVPLNIKREQTIHARVIIDQKPNLSLDDQTENKRKKDKPAQRTRSPYVCFWELTKFLVREFFGLLRRALSRLFSRLIP